jgi:hypothetical protein
MARVTKSQPATDRGTNQGVYLHLFTNLFAFAFKVQTRIYLRIYLSIHFLAGHGPGYKIHMYTSSRMGTHAGGNTPVSIARSRTGAAVLLPCNETNIVDHSCTQASTCFFRANRSRFGSAAGRNKVGVRPLVGVRIARTIRRGVLLECSFFVPDVCRTQYPLEFLFHSGVEKGGNRFVSMSRLDVPSQSCSGFSIYPGASLVVVPNVYRRTKQFEEACSRILRLCLEPVLGFRMRGHVSPRSIRCPWTTL